MKLGDLSKHQRLDKLLVLLSQSAITVEEFWAQMRAHGLKDKDIDHLLSGGRVE